MSDPFSRRAFVGLAAASLAASCAPAKKPAQAGMPRPLPVASPPAEPAADPFAELEDAVGGRVGVYALDPSSGSDLAHRADERFAMASTFKWALAAAVLRRVDREELSLDQAIRYGRDDVLEYAPVTKAHVAAGSMTVAALAEAAVTISDNTAANLLLELVGGPAGLTAFVRAAGDEVTRLDRNEPSLNTNLPGDERDTTSPRAMVGLLGVILLGEALTQASRDRLIAWLVGCKTCDQRLRAGFPEGWRIGDKTGTGSRGAFNDVGIAWPPDGFPLLVAAYLSDSRSSTDALSAAHATIARTIALRLGP